MRVGQANESLVLQDSSNRFWVLGGIFLIAGTILLYGGTGGFENFNELRWWMIVLVILMSLISIATGFWLIITHPRMTTKVDWQKRIVIITRNIFFSRTLSDFSFDNIRRFAVGHDKDEDGDAIWRVELELKNGQTVPLSIEYTRNQKECETVVVQANQFLSR